MQYRESKNRTLQFISAIVLVIEILFDWDTWAVYRAYRTYAICCTLIILCYLGLTDIGISKFQCALSALEIG